jgi:hypothetical protein
VINVSCCSLWIGTEGVLRLPVHATASLPYYYLCGRGNNRPLSPATELATEHSWWRPPSLSRHMKRTVVHPLVVASRGSNHARALEETTESISLDCVVSRRRYLMQHRHCAVPPPSGVGTASAEWLWQGDDPAHDEQRSSRRLPSVEAIAAIGSRDRVRRVVVATTQAIAAIGSRDRVRRVAVATTQCRTSRGATVDRRSPRQRHSHAVSLLVSEQ